MKNIAAQLSSLPCILGHLLCRFLFIFLPCMWGGRVTRAFLIVVWETGFGGSRLRGGGEGVRRLRGPRGSLGEAGGGLVQAGQLKQGMSAKWCCGGAIRIFWPDFWVEFWKVNFLRANFWGLLCWKKGSKNSTQEFGCPKVGRPKCVSRNSAPTSGSGGAKSPVQKIILEGMCFQLEELGSLLRTKSRLFRDSASTQTLGPPPIVVRSPKQGFNMCLGKKEGESSPLD